MVRDEDVLALLDRSVVEPLRRMPIAPVLSKGLELLTMDNRHQQLLDRFIHGLTRLVAENEDPDSRPDSGGESLVGAGDGGRQDPQEGSGRDRRVR